MKIEIVIETLNDDYLSANQVNDIKSYIDNHISNLEFGKMSIDKMKQLRLDMLNERKNPICDFCYRHEEAGPHSFRNYSKDHFAKYFDEVVTTTQDDGTVEDFKMRYFDIRFSNICNFKCRTCGPDFSSQWEQEYKINWPNKHRVIPDNRKPALLEELRALLDETSKQKQLERKLNNHLLIRLINTGSE